MNRDFNVSVTSLPEGCFSSMPKLRRLSMCETRIANFWTTVAALSKLPSLSELRFQNCLCCNDTGQCPLSSTEKTNSFVREIKETCYQRPNVSRKLKLSNLPFISKIFSSRMCRNRPYISSHAYVLLVSFNE